MLDMLKKDYLPAVMRFEDRLAKAVQRDKELGLNPADSYENRMWKKVKGLVNRLYEETLDTETKLQNINSSSALSAAYYYHDEILPCMAKMRADTDALELICDRTLWPMPTYRELLFGVD